MSSDQVPLSPTLSDLESMSGYDGASQDERGILTVRTGVKAFVRDGTQVLLVKERRADGSTFWTLPGGGVEPGESLRTCLRRELAEELQCRSAIGSPVGHCVYRHTSMLDTITLYSIFAAEVITDLEANEDEGIVDYRWCDPTSPPIGLLVPFRRALRGLNYFHSAIRSESPASFRAQSDDI
jgi:8-oxo-dGTP diphosphatase